MASDVWIEKLRPNPVEQFKIWLQEAWDAQEAEANAMVVSSIDTSGKPSSRVVLLKEIDTQGAVFYTNYHSRKGIELQTDPRICAVFFWPKLARQVRLEGITTLTSRQESEEYFHSRPRESQIGAWASRQSQPLPSRTELETAYREFEQKFAGQTIPLPDHWGGFRIEIQQYEFWQGRPSRLHDRAIYTPDSNKPGHWQIIRLNP